MDTVLDSKLKRNGSGSNRSWPSHGNILTCFTKSRDKTRDLNQVGSKQRP